MGKEAILLVGEVNWNAYKMDALTLANVMNSFCFPFFSLSSIN